MLIALSKGTYVRPHRHARKTESFHVVEGLGRVVIFDDKGDIRNVVEMGPPGSGRPFYYRLQKPYYHTVLVTSDAFVIHETTDGPFKASETEFAPWAPEEEDPLGRRAFLKQLRATIDNFVEGRESR